MPCSPWSRLWTFGLARERRRGWTGRARQAACRLFLEPLEDRALSSGAPAIPDDFGNDFGAAQQVALDGQGRGTQPGVIDYAGDVDVFRFIAPLTGAMAVR